MPQPAKTTDPKAEHVQLQLFKALTIALAVLLLAGAGYYFYRTRQTQPVAITVDGKQVAVAANMGVATKALAAVRKGHIAETYGSDAKPLFTEKVQLLRLPDAQTATIDTDDTIQSKVAAAVHVTVMASAIRVNNIGVVALPTTDMAKQTLDAIKQHYADMPPNDPVTSGPTFRENVNIVRKRVPARLTCGTVAEAVDKIMTPPPAKTYVVQNHDTGWLIARRFHLNFTKFVESNAGRDINKLKIGDTVNVSVTVPPITVIVAKRSDRVEPIRKGATGDAAGKRQISVETTYVNGQPSGVPRTLNVTTLERATPSRSVM